MDADISRNDVFIWKRLEKKVQNYHLFITFINKKNPNPPWKLHIQAGSQDFKPPD